MRAYEYRHRVGFEETSLAGNVYFANYLRWQGRCREMFLRQHAPEIVQALHGGLGLLTTRVSCNYFQEAYAFDEILLRMRVGALGRNRLSMLFDYLRVRPDAGEDLLARGEQEVVCRRRQGEQWLPAAFPDALREGLAPFLEQETVGSVVPR